MSFFELVKKVLQTVNIRSLEQLKKLIKVIACAVTFFYWFKYHRARKHDNIVTLPHWKPIIGHVPFFAKHFENNLNEELYKLIKQAGFPPLSVMTGFSKDDMGILVIDPEMVKFIFHTKFESFQKGERVHLALEELLGDGIFASDPPQWKFHRKIASRMFSMRNLKDYMFDCTINHTKKVMRKINSIDLSDVNIYDILARFTLDTFTAIAFGKSCDSIDIYPEKHPFAVAFDNSMTSVAKRYLAPKWLWMPLRMFNHKFGTYIGNEGQIKRDIKVINEFANKVLDSRQSAISNISDESGDRYNDIISLFMKHDKTLSRDQLRHIAMNMIIAGRDTTRLILSWFLYEMCKRPTICNKIYDEISEYISLNHTTEMEYDKINDNLLYLESALLETLRLNPVVPFLIRHAQCDVKLPNGQIIRERNEVVIPTYIFARNPKIYNDPLKFDPNRFYNKKQTPVNVYDVYHYPYFNINPRLCLGRRLALMESKVFIFYFFQQFKFKMADPNQKIQIQTGIVLNMKEGLRLKLTKR